MWAGLTSRRLLWVVRASETGMFKVGGADFSFARITHVALA